MFLLHAAKMEIGGSLRTEYWDPVTLLRPVLGDIFRSEINPASRHRPNQAETGK
jgi:hypothetical protein